MNLSAKKSSELPPNQDAEGQISEKVEDGTKKPEQPNLLKNEIDSKDKALGDFYFEKEAKKDSTVEKISKDAVNVE